MSKNDKTDKKVKKADKKTGRKCGALLALLALSSVFATGCASTGAQPSRSQNLNNDFRNCIVVVAARASVTNTTVVANSEDGLQPIELFTQTMKNEGSEHNQPTATPTNEVKPTTTVNYGLTSSTPGGAAWIDSLDKGCASLLSSWLGSGNANGTMEVTKKDGTKETVTCKDGVCTTASGECVTCTDGSCSRGGDCPGGVCSPQ